MTLEELLDKIKAEPHERLVLYGLHYLRRLRKLTPNTPRRAAYEITKADAKRVAAYIDEGWEKISETNASVLPRADVRGS
jgi:hypothetical protein